MTKVELRKQIEYLNSNILMRKESGVSSRTEQIHVAVLKALYQAQGGQMKLRRLGILEIENFAEMLFDSCLKEDERVFIKSVKLHKYVNNVSVTTEQIVVTLHNGASIRVVYTGDIIANYAQLTTGLIASIVTISGSECLYLRELLKSYMRNIINLKYQSKRKEAI